LVSRLVEKLKGWTRPGAMRGESPMLVVGLGNPGPRYARNRHNVGYQCVDYIARRHAISVERKRFQALLGEGTLDDHRVILAKPLTFMNGSGEAVGPLSRWYKVAPQQMLIIYDDLDLPLGKVRVRPGGSSGGHHGIESLIAELHTPDFCRVRVGIGRPERGDPIDYVLNDFSREQAPVIERTYDLVEQIVLCFLRQGIKEAMNTYNGLTP
jgi:PTH1 family peptidyl-tRNA hydrolase